MPQDKIKIIGKRNKNVSKIAILTIALCLTLSQGSFAESGTSTNYNLDYGRMAGGSEQNTSSSYQLTGSITDESAEGESSNYTLRNIYSDDVAGPVCGNGILEAGEQCEGDNFNGLTCSNYGFNQGNLQCIACSIVTNSCSNSGNGGGGGGGGGFIDNGDNLCGNGKKEGNEQCDDGNKTEGDGCNASCLLEDLNPLEQPTEPDPKNNLIPNDLKPLEFNPFWDPDLIFDWPDFSSESNDNQNITNEKPEGELKTPQASSEKTLSLNANLFEGRDVYPQMENNIQNNLNQDPKKEILIILDETPFIATTTKPDTDYEMIILNPENKIMVRQGLKSDRNGLLIGESIQYLDYGNYKIVLLDQKHHTVKKWLVQLEDHDYRLQEDLAINDNPHREIITLGKKSHIKTLTGKGEPMSIYQAYLQGPKANDPTIHLTTKADHHGNYSLKLPDLKEGFYNLNLIQIYVDGKIGRNVRYTFEIKAPEKRVFEILVVILVITILGLILKKRGSKKIHKKTAVILIMLFLLPQSTQALDLTPHLLVYEGKLLDNNNNPVITSQTFRFSMWNSDDLVPGDILGDGSINVGAATYGGWQEVHTLTPNNDGTFFVDLGSSTAIGELNISSQLNLQVEIKTAGDPDTSYELMDPTGDNGADTDDRQTIGSAPYTNNADYIDNTEIGTNTGNIATLGFGDMWDINYIPGGTNIDSFTLDSDNTAGPGDTIDLVFGDLLAETIRFDISNDWFDFSNDINLNQHEIKNVALDNLPAAPGAPVTGQIYHNTTDGNSYIWNGATWEDITAGAGGITIKTTSFNVEYDNSTVEADGSNNKGTLVSHFIDEGGIDKYNYYEWTTSETSLQDTDLVISYRLPLDFISFTGNPLNILYQTNDANAANNAVDAELYDTTGTAVALVGGSNLANASWTTENITFGGAPTFTPGDVITLKVKLSTLNAGYARISNITLNYNSN